MLRQSSIMVATTFILGTTVALAQPPQSTSAAAGTSPDKAPDSLSLYFDQGSSTVSADNQSVLDTAARTYRDGKPIVMVISGASDSTGSPSANLRLSQLRADHVLQGLVARGIPVDRFQILAKGETEPAVAAPEGTAEARNRRVDITWR